MVLLLVVGKCRSHSQEYYFKQRVMNQCNSQTQAAEAKFIDTALKAEING